MPPIPKNPARQNHPFVVFNPVDKKELNPELGGETAAAKSMKPGGAPGETAGPGATEIAPKKKRKVVKEESVKDQIRRHIKKRQAMLYRIDEDVKLAEGVSIKDIADTADAFITHASGHLNLNHVPPIRFKNTEPGETFATWTPDEITISVTNRHPMDVFRSLAHELVHQKQHEDDVLHAESGTTGSEHENEANAVAGVIMRDFAKANPNIFGLQAIEEGLKPLPKLGGSKLGRVLRPRKGSSRSGGGKIFGAIKKIFSGKKKKTGKEPPSFEDRVQKGLEADAVKREIKKRKIQDTHAAAKRYATALGNAGAATNKDRPKLKDEIRDAALDLQTRGMRADPAKDLNNVRKVKKHFVKKFEKTSNNPPSLRETIALTRKAQSHQIPYEIILEVYQRGQKDWKPGGHLTMEQWAFNRVNSFIADGKAAEIDNDLYIVEE